MSRSKRSRLCQRSRLRHCRPWSARQSRTTCEANASSACLERMVPTDRQLNGDKTKICGWVAGSLSLQTPLAAFAFRRNKKITAFRFSSRFISFVAYRFVVHVVCSSRSALWCTLMTLGSWTPMRPEPAPKRTALAAASSSENTVSQRSHAVEPARAEKDLRENEKSLSTILDHSPNPTFLKDPEGRYLYVNTDFERAPHIRQEQIQGKRDD